MYIPVLTFLVLTFTTASATALQGRGLAGAVYVCTQPNFKGKCTWYPPSSQCYLSGAGSAPASLGPDEGGSCTLYAGLACQDDTFISNVVYPGISHDLRKFGSLKCSAGPSVKIVPVGSGK
ncbi:hypothetical protein DM02DRAFT_177316 [Periconia macrospinosa]|uniref:Uncharacterized protein n=1 Tax=Periconia macrospinosa TaxID=97972 RepID=A0A2V1E1Z5_9PLEO|nr:hypothetical protein DM02DRAFT_177316 [Periconia macrospinosa]